MDINITMTEDQKKDLVGLVDYATEMNYEDMVQQLCDEPLYLEEGVVSEEEIMAIKNLSINSARLLEIVIKASMNPNNLHVYALAYRVWQTILQGE